LPKNSLSAIERLDQLAQQPNIAGEFPKNKISEAGQQVCEEYQIDRSSRAAWEKDARAAMQSVLQEKQEKNYPFPGAANVQFPLLTTASLQFAARAYPAIVQGNPLVRCQVIGADKDERKKQRKERVETHMSYQLMKEMPEWEVDTDTLLHQLPVLGCSFRKVFYSHEQLRPVSKLISAFDLVVNQGATSLETVPRVTHRFELYPHEIAARMRAGTFEEIDINSAPDPVEDDLRRHKEQRNQDQLSPHSFLEQHRYYDFDGDGLAEPWIFTVHEASEKVVRVAANYDLKRATLGSMNQIIDLPRYNFFVKYGFIPDPAGGFYDVGFGTLLRSLNGAINTLLNLAIDGAHLQNAGGGWIGAGLNLKKSTFRFEPGVYHVVEAAGAAVRDAIVQLQHPGPSDTLFKLLEALLAFGREITATQEIMTGEAGRSQPATTTLAQIEQGLKLFTAAYKRVFRALGQEFKLLYDINGRYPNQQKYLNIIDWQPGLSSFQPAAGPMPGAAPPMGDPSAPSGAPGIGQPMQAPGAMPGQMPQQPPEQPPSMAADYDYDDCDIVPVADPQMVTDMQRMSKAQLQMELAQHPTIGPTMNAAEVGRRILEAALIDDIDAVIPPKEGPSPAEELQLRGAVAEVEDKEAGAKLKEAQTIKTLADAEMASEKTQLEKDKLAMAGMKDERQFALDTAGMESQNAAAQRDFEAQQMAGERDFVASRVDADRQFATDQFDKSEEAAFRQRELEQAELEAEEAREMERQRFELERSQPAE
jgi:chaperonin GroES